MELELTGMERITLCQILPQQIGSLGESLKVKEIRSKLMSEEFKDKIKWQETIQGVNFDPNALEDIEPKTFEFSEKEQELIAYGFLHDEQDGSVATGDTYTDLLEEFWEAVEEVREQDSSNP